MANLTPEDEKLLEELGLSNIPDIEKQVVLEEIDLRMTKRFIANLLVSLDPARASQLEEEVEKIPSDKTEEIISKIIEMHPDAVKVLQESAKQIVDELKKKPSQNDRAATTIASTSTDESDNLSQNKNKEIDMDTNATDTNSAQAPAPMPAAAANAPAYQASDASDPMAGLNNTPSTPPISSQNPQDAPQSPGSVNMENTSSPISQAAAPEEPAIPNPAPAPENPLAPANASVEPATSAQSSDISDGDKPLPVPQQESASPFGDEIKLVKDEEPAPVQPTPQMPDANAPDSSPAPEATLPEPPAADTSQNTPVVPAASAPVPPANDIYQSPAPAMQQSQTATDQSVPASDQAASAIPTPPPIPASPSDQNSTNTAV